jgi:hypothetical protein
MSILMDRLKEEEVGLDQELEGSHVEYQNESSIRKENTTIQEVPKRDFQR